MLLQRTPEDYKQRVMADFDQRTNYERSGSFHPAIAERLVQLAEPQPGQHLVDIATGTGLAAIPAAKRFGATGRVLGVDFSKGMLEQAQRKLKTLGIKTVDLLESDVETLNLPPETVDGILCSSALVYLCDIPKALQTWYGWLKPGGWLAFSTFAENTVAIATLFRQLAQAYNLQLFNPLELLGTPQKCELLLHRAGFTRPLIVVQEFDDYLPIPEGESLAERTWQMNLNSPFYQIDLPPDLLQEFRLEYQEAIDELEQQQRSPQGLRNYYETFFVLANKPS